MEDTSSALSREWVSGRLAEEQNGQCGWGGGEQGSGGQMMRSQSTLGPDAQDPADRDDEGGFYSVDHQKPVKGLERGRNAIRFVKRKDTVRLRGSVRVPADNEGGLCRGGGSWQR